jgi:hypothetical protein
MFSDNRNANKNTPALFEDKGWGILLLGVPFSGMSLLNLPPNPRSQLARMAVSPVGQPPSLDRIALPRYDGLPFLEVSSGFWRTHPMFCPDSRVDVAPVFAVNLSQHVSTPNVGIVRCC